MKTILYLIICLCFLSLASAQPYPTAQQLTIALEVTTGFTITAANQDSEVQATLSYLPEERITQKLQPTATPPATITVTKEKITYTWKKAPEGTYTFGYTATLVTTPEQPELQPTYYPVNKLPPETLTYTEATATIDITRAIEQQARQLTTQETFSTLYNLANWVKNTINYSLDTLTVESSYPSSWVLQNKRGVCDEITNLFISFARSLGIPARFVSGLVYSDEHKNFGNHGWAEVYYPGYGWIPYDVTFGQYGWIDASHIKLLTTKDPKTPGVTYRWYQEKTTLTTTPITMDATIVDHEGTQQSPITITLQPAETPIRFGSYLPVTATITNNKNNYLVPSLSITKAPALEGSNTHQLLLPPQGTATTTWIIPISEDLDKDYIYTATIEVIDDYGQTAETTITYQATAPYITKQQALDYLITQQPLPEHTEDIINCIADKQHYYTEELATIICTIKNDEAATTVHVCLYLTCQEVPVASKGTASITFQLPARAGRFTITAERNNKISYTFITLPVTTIPRIKITSTTQQATYNTEQELTLHFTPNTAITDVTITILGKTVTYATLNEEETLTFTTNSKYLIEGLPVDISYTDETGKNYEQHEQLPFTVTNLSWWAKLKHTIRSWF